MEAVSPELIRSLTEFVKSILYPILLVVLFYIFRDSIKSLMSRLKKFVFSHKETSLEIEASDSPDENEKLKPLATPVEKEDELSSEIEDEAQEEPNLTQKLIACIEKQNFDAADKVFEEYSSKEEDDKKIERNKGFYLFLKYEIGQEQSAIEELKEFSKNCKYESNKKFSLSWLIIIYGETFQVQSRLNLLREAMYEFTEEDNVVWSVCELSDALIAVGDIDEAKRLVLDWLKKDNVAKNQAMLYKAMGDIEKENNNPTNQLLCYDKALEMSPGDKERLFDVAYLADEHGLKEIARGNYKRVIKLEPDNDSALNNYGVQAQNESLNTVALHYYDQSIALDSTLAMANRGYLLLNAGFIEEAEEIVKKAIKEIEEPHENIFRLKTEIEERKKTENKKWNEIETQAIARQKLLREYTEQYYTGDERVFSTTWKTSSESEVEVSVDNDELTLKWNEARGLAAGTISITVSAKIKKASFRGKYSSKADNSGASLLMAMNKEIDCVGFVSKDGKNLRILSEDADEKLNIALSS